jgi:uncharacterized membrane protein
VRAHPRLFSGALLLLLLTGGLAAGGMNPALALLVGFDTGALIFLVLTAVYFNRSTPQKMRVYAREQDVGRWGILWCSILLSVVVLVALGLELQGKQGGWVSIVVACGSIMLSWLFMNTVFAIHYAHGYYGDYGLSHQGLDFPGEDEPDYWDFTYFAIVIGMTFQVSDVQITSRHLRRMALLHGVIAFFLNVFIIAMTVNIVAGQA